MLITALTFALQIAAVTPPAVIRVNQLGYLPDAPKVAVLCALQGLSDVRSFAVTAGSVKVLERPAGRAKWFGPCIDAYRLDFSDVRTEGEYRITAGGLDPVAVRIRRKAYAGAADTLLYYMREQRSAYNPVFKTVVNLAAFNTGFIVYHDDVGDYSTNEPIMDGTANLSYLLAAMSQ